jgi:hypothetical protein
MVSYLTLEVFKYLTVLRELTRYLMVADILPLPPPLQALPLILANFLNKVDCSKKDENL